MGVKIRGVELWELMSAWKLMATDIRKGKHRLES